MVRIATFNPKVKRWISILLHSKSFYLRNNSNSPPFFSWQKNVIFAQLPLRKPRTFNFCGGEGDLTNFLHLFQGERDLQLSQYKWAQIPWENVVAGANGLKTWFLRANGLKFLGKNIFPGQSCSSVELGPICPRQPHFLKEIGLICFGQAHFFEELWPICVKEPYFP